MEARANERLTYFTVFAILLTMAIAEWRMQSRNCAAWCSGAWGALLVVSWTPREGACARPRGRILSGASICARVSPSRRQLPQIVGSSAAVCSQDVFLGKPRDRFQSQSGC